MNTKRYSFWLFMIAALCLFCGGLIILIFKLLRRTSIPLENIYEKSILSSPWSKYDELVGDNVLSANEMEQHGEVLRTCSIRSCVDFSRCAGDFKIHVYPSDVSDSQTNGRVYDKIIETIRTSRYHTTKADEACLFIVAHDTTDRDVRSTNYVHRLQDKLKMSELWKNGQNHVVFNSYSGTFPDYAETYRFNLGNAMLAKASISAASYRPGFDISFPLFLNNHPFKDNALNASLTTKMYPSGHKYKLAFKGKRYLYGVGSEVRNKVFLLHNRKEIVLLTTCKHGNQWQKLADAKCEDDNKEYDRYSYSDLLENSTFCLVPRGRRLGSFRFLEALKVGCIPVVLSDDWILPFQEVIDWSKCSLVVSEHNLLQIPSILTMLSDSTITSMRQQALFIYESYFSSLEKIVSVTLEILKERIIPSYRRHHYMWNHPPGALAVFPEFSRSLKDFPFYYPLVGISPKPRFTAVIYAVSAVPYASSPLFQLIRVINESKFVDQILIIWLSTSRIPRKDLWPKAKVLMSVVYASRKILASFSVIQIQRDLCCQRREYSSWHLSNKMPNTGFQNLMIRVIRISTNQNRIIKCITQEMGDIINQKGPFKPVAGAQLMSTKRLD